MPRIGVTLAGLLEQDLAGVSLERRIMAVVDGQQHRHHPHPGTGNETKHRHAPAPGLGSRRDPPGPLPIAPDQRRPRQQHQHRQEPHALGNRAQSRSKESKPCPSPVRAAQQMTHYAIQRERGHGHQDHVDLSAFGLQAKLQAHEQPQRGIAPGLAAPEPGGQVVAQPERQQGRQQRGQQEGNAPVPGQRKRCGLQPHEHRGFFRIELDTAVREQPLPGFHHIACGQHEARLVGRRRIAQAQPRQQTQAGQDQQYDETCPMQAGALRAGRQADNSWERGSDGGAGHVGNL